MNKEYFIAKVELPDGFPRGIIGCYLSNDSDGGLTRLSILKHDIAASPLKLVPLINGYHGPLKKMESKLAYAINKISMVALGDPPSLHKDACLNFLKSAAKTIESGCHDSAEDILKAIEILDKDFFEKPVLNHSKGLEALTLIGNAVLRYRGL